MAKGSNNFPLPYIKGLRIELTSITKSPLAPLGCESYRLCQIPQKAGPLAKGGEEGFYKIMSLLL